MFALDKCKRKPTVANRLMKLDPHFCDVIIARWEKLTGEKAVRISGA